MIPIWRIEFPATATVSGKNGSYETPVTVVMEPEDVCYPGEKWNVAEVRDKETGKRYV